jgi:ABC-2 type transport system permease protein
MGIVIPRGFGERLRRGEKGKVQVLADGSDSNAAVIGLGYMGIALRKYSNHIVQETLRRQGLRRPPAATVTPEIRVWYNPELKSAFFMIPGVLGLLLMVTTMMTTSMGIVREKEIGTLEQLIVTPIRSHELILGKLLPFVLVGFIEVSVVLTAATLIFQVPIRSGIPLIFFFCGLFLLTTLGLGLFISTISNTQQQAMMTSGFFVMMPFMMLSGFVFPIENMPEVIQAVTYLIPLRYFFVIIRALFLKGVGFAALWREALALLVWGVGILGLSILRFRRSL